MDTLARIRLRLADVLDKIRALDAERAELEVAERVVAKLEVGTNVPSSPEGGRGQPTQVDLIVATLKASKAPWFGDWLGLQKSISELHGTIIPRSSLQPHLSNLKNAGIIVRNGANIALRERVEKGAGPQSDGSYDPDSAVPADDDTPRFRERTRVTTDFSAPPKTDAELIG